MQRIFRHVGLLKLVDLGAEVLFYHGVGRCVRGHFFIGLLSELFNNFSLLLDNFVAVEAAFELGKQFTAEG